MPLDLLRFYIMPYWSKGKLGIREGDYTGTQKFHLGSGRSMAYNVLVANAVVPRLYTLLPVPTCGQYYIYIYAHTCVFTHPLGQCQGKVLGEAP